MIVDTDMTPIDMKAIPPEYVAPIVDALIERGLDAWIYQDNEWFLRDPSALTPSASKARSDLLRSSRKTSKATSKVW